MFTGCPDFEFHLGRLNGELDEKVYEVQTVLEKMCPGRVNLTKNLMADRWSKVMINATFSGMSTVCADTFYYVIHTERALTCAVRIGRECIRVCHAMGITLPSIFGLDFNKLFDYNDIAGQNAEEHADREQNQIAVLQNQVGDIHCIENITVRQNSEQERNDGQCNNHAVLPHVAR